MSILALNLYRWLLILVLHKFSKTQAFVVVMEFVIADFWRNFKKSLTHNKVFVEKRKYLTMQ